ANARDPYYQTYPGYLWRVPIAIVGGSAPHLGRIINGPTGLELNYEYDPNTGFWDIVMQWPNPVLGLHNIILEIYDQNNTTPVTLNWNLHVRVENAVFVSLSRGNNNNDGTFANPIRDFLGLMGPLEPTTTFSRYTAYFESGTYNTLWDYDPSWPNQFNMPMRADQKAVQFIGIPGENVTIDVSPDGGPTFTGGAFGLGNGTNNGSPFVMKNIRCIGTCHQPTGTAQRLVLVGESSNMLIFESTFEGQVGPGTQGQNPSYFQFNRAQSNYAKGRNIFMRNNINDLNNYMFSEIYDMEQCVFQSNIISGTTSGISRLVYLKELSRQFAIRGNTSLDTDSICVFIDSSVGQYTDIQVEYNNWKMATTGERFVVVGSTGTVPVGDIQLSRNTATGGVIQFRGTGGGGPVNIQDCIRQTSEGVSGIDETVVGITWNLIRDSQAASGIVDVNNKLIDRITNLGRLGAEVSDNP
ncbi:hypothetical protein MNBD_ALPHA03-1307, partial [hydrothermal vent metagenome]